MNEQFEPLDNNEVLFVSAGRVLMPNATFKVGEFLDALAQAVSDREEDWSDDNEGWFSDGLECEALRFSAQGWQRGRVRIRLEFCQDESRPKLLNSQRDEPRRRERTERDRTERDPLAGASRYEADDLYRSEKPEPRFDDPYRRPDEY